MRNQFRGTMNLICTIDHIKDAIEFILHASHLIVIVSIELLTFVVKDEFIRIA